MISVQTEIHMIAHAQLHVDMALVIEVIVMNIMNANGVAF